MADSQSSVQGAYGPVDSPLGEIPEILNSDPDLQHAWKVVNWVYDTKNYMQGLPLGTPFSRRLKKDIPIQTAGLLLVGLKILGDTAHAKFMALHESDPTKNADAESWGGISIQVDRRRLFVLEKQPRIIASMRSYESPPAVGMLAATCEQAMEDLREEEKKVGSNFVEANRLWFPELLDWWKLLQIAAERIPGAADIVNKKAVASNLKRLEMLIAQR